MIKLPYRVDSRKSDFPDTDPPDEPGPWIWAAPKYGERGSWLYEPFLREIVGDEHFAEVYGEYIRTEPW